MSLDNQLFVQTGDFLYDRLSLAQLARRVQDLEEYWASLPPGRDARSLADTIMLAAYEVASAAGTSRQPGS
jgi:hypothetical protein